MAFFRKAANTLGNAVSNHQISSSKPSFFQAMAIRCMSTSKLFIGGLSYSTDESSLREAFSKYGDVAEARVICDRETGRSRGFGFITFTSAEEASAAIQAWDQQELQGRRIRVDFANDRARGYGGGGGFGGGNYGGGGGGGYNDNGYGGNYGSGGGGDGGYNNSYGGNYGGGSGGYNDSQNFSATGGAGASGNPYGSDVGVGSSPNSSGSDGFGNNYSGEQSTFSKDEFVNVNFGDEDGTPKNYADRRS